MVSVIIPTYNRPQLVVRSIKSILGQTYRDLEVLVMDDSRNEDTKNAVAEIHDPRVRYIYNPERLGFVENKNQGVRMASRSSKYIAFLDDDDEYLPLFLEKTVAALDSDSDAVAAVTSAELRRQDGTFVKRYECEKVSFWKTSIGNGGVLRRSVFFDLGIWFDKDVLFEDLDFGVRVTQGRKYICISEPLRIYYGYPSENGQSNSTSYTTATPPEKLEAFWNKNKGIYIAEGPEAVAWARMLTGKWLMRSGHIKLGRSYLWEALKARPSFSEAMFYAVALLFPASFRSINAMVLKNKIMGVFKK